MNADPARTCTLACRVSWPHGVIRSAGLLGLTLLLSTSCEREPEGHYGQAATTEEMARQRRVCDTLIGRARANMYEAPAQTLELADSLDMLAERCRYGRGRVYAMRLRGLALSAAGQAAEAETALRSAYVRAKATHEDTLRGISATSLGYSLMRRGQTAEAKTLLLKACHILEGRQVPRELAKAQLNLALLEHFTLQQHATADSLFELATLNAQLAKEISTEALVAANRSIIAEGRGDMPLAREYAKQAVELLGQHPRHQSDLVFALKQSARLAQLDHDMPLAISLAGRARRAAYASGDPVVISCALNLQAELLADQGRPEEALATYRKLFTALDSIKNFERSRVLAVSAMALQSERTRAEVAKLRQQTHMTQQRLDAYRVLAIVGGSLLTLVGMLAFWLWHSQQRLEQASRLLRRQYQAIGEKNAQIEQLNENLEATVLERTASLARRTEQILEFAHYNSHTVRGPLARILGLAYLIDTCPDEPERTDLALKMGEAAHELDTAIRQVSKKLELESPTQGGLQRNAQVPARPAKQA